MDFGFPGNPYSLPADVLLARPMYSHEEMYKQFNDRARTVLKASNELAFRTNSESIEPEQVLLTILNEGVGVAMKVMESLRVDFLKLRRRLSDSVSNSPTLRSANTLARVLHGT